MTGYEFWDDVCCTKSTREKGTTSRVVIGQRDQFWADRWFEQDLCGHDGADRRWWFWWNKNGHVFIWIHWVQHQLTPRVGTVYGAFLCSLILHLLHPPSCVILPAYTPGQMIALLLCSAMAGRLRRALADTSHSGVTVDWSLGSEWDCQDLPRGQWIMVSPFSPVPTQQMRQNSPEDHLHKTCSASSVKARIVEFAECVVRVAGVIGCFQEQSGMVLEAASAGRMTKLNANLKQKGPKLWQFAWNCSLDSNNLLILWSK